MLQQTRADAVVPYFEAFLRRFPDVAALASADEERVLAAWEGLGYYRRARNLHRAARAVVARGGRLPTDEEGWRELPGVGPYTAAAIAAIAYGRSTLAIDGNVRRVGARLLARATPGDGELRAALQPLLDERAAADSVEALIELGATVCTPRRPACERCPLRPHCTAHGEGSVEHYPAPRRRRRAPRLKRYARVHRRGRCLWLVRRDGDGLLGGLWGFPQEEHPPEGRRLAAVHHAYTHLRLELVPILRDAEPNDANGRWFDAPALRAAPLSALDRRVVDRLNEIGGDGEALLSSRA